MEFECQCAQPVRVGDRGMDWWASRREDYFKENHKEVDTENSYIKLRK